MENLNPTELCRRVIDEDHCRAMDVSVFKQGKEVFSFKEGIKNKRTREKVGKDTLFSIGSISKMFSSVSIMMLVEAGKLSLDTPVYKILPQFKMKDKNYQKITVEMLLNHSSGLPSTSKMGKYTNKANRQFLRETIDFYHDLYLNHMPGKLSCYCNDAYGLVELIIEQVSKMSYANFVYQNICIPCGLENTDFQIHEIRSQRLAMAETDFGTDYPQEFVNGIASGGIISTAEDISKFMNTFLSKQLISEESILNMGNLHMASPYGNDLNTVDRYGLGWDEVEIEPFRSMGQRVWRKNGSTYGFNSSSLVFYDEEMIVTVLMSDENLSAESVAKKLAYLFLGEPSYHPNILKEIEETGASDGLYGGNNQIYKVNNVLKKEIEIRKNGEYVPYVEGGFCPYKNPEFKVVARGKRTLLVVEYDDAVFEGIRQRKILAQKLLKSYQSNNWENLKDERFICISEAIDCRRLGIAPVFLKIEMEKGYSDTLLSPHPLHILNDRNAVPFIEVLGNSGKEMDGLERLNQEAIQVGQRVYVNLNGIPQLTNKEIHFRNEEIDWYRIEDEIDTLRFDGRVRCFIINDREEILFDSDLCKHLPEESVGNYIGFIGESGAKAAITLMEESK